MPRSTCNYGFEFRLLDWALELGKISSGGARSFVASFDDAGVVLLVEFGTRQRPEAMNKGWLFFDPFDAPEYIWMEWNGLHQSAVERLLGEPLSSADFERRTIRSGDSVVLGEFPTSWRVMF